MNDHRNRDSSHNTLEQNHMENLHYSTGDTRGSSCESSQVDKLDSAFITECSERVSVLSGGNYTRGDPKDKCLVNEHGDRKRPTQQE